MAPDPDRLTKVIPLWLPPQRLTAEFCTESISVLDWKHPAPGFVTVEAVGAETRTHYSTTLPANVAAALSVEQTITIAGTLTKLDEFAEIYRGVLQPFVRQESPALTIEITLRSAFDEGPDSGLDAALDYRSDDECRRGQRGLRSG